MLVEVLNGVAIGAEKEAESQGYVLVVSNTNGDSTRERRTVQMLQERLAYEQNLVQLVDRIQVMIFDSACPHLILRSAWFGRAAAHRGCGQNVPA